MQMGLFDEENRLEKLTQLGDALVRLNNVIQWERFRPILEEALRKEPKGPGGRPRYDCILMFKALVLQRIYNLSDDQLEFQINDRISFMRFLGLNVEDRVPDANTYWTFRSALTDADAIRKLFDAFTRQLEDARVITHNGSIVDATFVDAPRQRNTREENACIKDGKIPGEWKAEENANKLRQKDTDARWAKKGNETHYGYKNHVKADADSKLVTGYVVTSANVHDSKALAELVDKSDKVLYADSAYSGKELRASLPETAECRIHEKGCRNHPLTEEQKARNREKSKIRVRIEHIFGYMTMSLHGLTVRSIGIARARLNAGLTNLVCNLCRYKILMRTA